MIWLARALWLLTLLLAAAAAYIGLTDPAAIATAGFTGIGVLTPTVVGVVATVYATAGLLILRHRSRHVIGWLLLLSGLAIAFVFATQMLAAAVLPTNQVAAAWLAWLSSLAFWPALVLAGPGIALVFPDGRFAGQLWRSASFVCLSVVPVALLLSAVRPTDIGGVILNPVATTLIPAWVYSLVEVVGLLALLILVFLGIGSIVVRYRASRGVERPQIRWFAFSAITSAVVFAVAWMFPFQELTLVWLASLALLPMSVLVAVTRYRLYDIDRLINRTLVYVPLVGIVAGLYAALVVFFGRIFTAATGNSSDAAAVISALILAAVFTPLRKWIEARVDRYFKPTAPAAESAGLGTPWTQPEFEAAVERIARRVVAERS